MARPRAQVEEPQGLVYRPQFLSEEEEHALLGQLEGLEFHAVVMRGQTARRTVRHYGYDYDYQRYGRLVPAEPIPGWLEPVRDRCAGLGGVRPEELAQALVLRYPAGATIGWHRDAPMFGAQVIGVSLLGACRMRFQRGKDEKRRVYELELAPRSAYVLAGEARTEWQHSIPAARTLRYSITFRTVPDPAPGRSDGDGAPTGARFLATGNGRRLSATFYDSEEDMRQGDEALSQMNPQGTAGQRTSVEMYEVAIDVQF